IQPSEFVKATFIVSFSKHLDIVKENINSPKNLLGLLPDEVIAEKIGLPLETVIKMHEEEVQEV
ncbi:MAG: hypothetical protein IJ419_15920, partial [Agathobacter sp.]|nr:hypothetical protein [Agathobacter sp.]